MRKKNFLIFASGIPLPFKAMIHKRFLFCIFSCFAAFSVFAAVPQVTVKYASGYTGRGNNDELICEVLIVPERELVIDSFLLDPGDTELSDLRSLKVSAVSSEGNEDVLGVYAVQDSRAFYRVDSPVTVSSPLMLRLRADVSGDAEEGNRISVVFAGVRTVDGFEYMADEADSEGLEILLCRRRLYAPGDYGSRNWRIPALLALPDGALLAVNDKRKYNETDLPEDIDIVARRSLDNGHTWSEPVDIVVGQGYKKGFGDPALALTPDGDILCVFVGGNYLWASTVEDPQCSYVARSCDGGMTWSAPENITSVLWGENAVNPQCRKYTYSFFGSGNGLTLKRGKYAGRVLFAAAMGPASNLNNHAVYSDDGGRTWNVSDLAFEGGDEAKMVELSDGRILMSIRRTGHRGYSISSDGGVTWEGQGLWPEMNTNACNGDMIRYSSIDCGDDANLLLHSIPNSMERRNVSVFCSYDEGQTWCSPKVICSGKSVYSSMTVLPDGTIGIYLEENPEPEDCSLWFMNFSLDWLQGKSSRLTDAQSSSRML